MRRGQRDPLTTAAIIKAAIPRNAAKVITRELAPLGCSDRQGRRIASGKVPSKFRLALIAILDAAFAKNIEAIQHHQAVLKAQDYAEMVSRSADRRAEADRPADREAARLGEGTDKTRSVASNAGTAR